MTNKRLDRQAWLRHARAWKNSGLPCADYAKKEGLHASTLSWWAWKLRSLGESVPGGRGTRRGKRSSKKTRKVETMPLTEVSPVVLETAVDNRIELETAGVVVRFGSSFDEGHLLRVLEVLEGRR